MTESRNRDLATSIGAAVASDNIATDGTLAISGVTTYTNLSDLPSSGVSAGDLGFVTANNGLYIRGTSGWYVIALVNTSPTYTTSPNSSYSLATDGSTTTVITVVATDPEGFAITYSAIADSNFNGLATVSQGTGNNTNVFTITPKSEANATTTSGTLTFRASDSVNNTDVVSTFTLVFINTVADNGNTIFLAKADGAKQNQTFTDSSTSAVTASVNGSSVIAPLNSRISPHRSQGYSWSFDGTTNQYVRVSSPDSNIDFGYGDFTIEFWFFIRSMPSSEDTILELNTSSFGDSILINLRNSYGVAAYLNSGSVSGALTGHDPDTMGSISGLTSTDWTHFALVRNGSTITLYLNGKSVDSGSYSTSAQDFTNQTEVLIGGGYSGTVDALMYDLRVVKGTAVYTTTFTPPSSPLEDISGTALLACRAGWFKDLSGTYDLIVKQAPEISFETPPEVDFDKYSATDHGASIAFEGTRGRSLSFTNSSDYDLNGSGTAWSVEFWVYNSNWASPTEQHLIEKFGSATTGWTVYSYGQNRLDWYNGATNNTIYQNSSLVDDTGWLNKTWHHVVFTKNTSNNFGVFINGQRINYIANFTNPAGADSGTLDIGARNQSGGNPVNGYMSDIRIVKGSTPYDPTQTTLTVPSAPLTAITNTKFLLGIGNQAGVSDAIQNTTMQLNGDATSSTTQTQNATSSMYFDGTGDSVQIPSVEKLGTDNFTIEWWAYQTATASYAQIFAQGYGTTGIGSHFRSNGEITVTRPQSSLQVDHTFSSTGVDTANTWYHVALTRGADTIRCYVNGVEKGNGANTTDYQAGTVYLGMDGNGTSYPYTGYIEDFRFTKGLVRYPLGLPTAETLSADSNTFFLGLHTSNIQTHSGNDWTIGDGGTTPTAYNFGPASGMKSFYFNGTTASKLSLDNSGNSAYWTMGNYANGASDQFSIEFWFWPDEDVITDTATTLFSTYAQASNGQELRFLFRQSTTTGYRTNRLGANVTLTASATITTFPVRKWNHFYYAEEWSGSTMYYAAIANGVIVDSGSTTSGTASFDMQNITIGCRGDNTQPFKGYISNLRMQRGAVAFPNAAKNQFTAPSSELLG